MSFRFARFALPALALVALVATACVPVKEFGKNLLATTITNGCLPGLPSAEPMNGFRSPSKNFSRAVCAEGVAGHSVGANGVTLQVVNSSGGPNGTGSGAGFVTGGLNKLGDINSIKVTTTGGSNNVTVSLVLDKSGDSPNFLCPGGPDGSPGAGFCGDAIASFGQVVGAATGHEYVFLNNDPVNFFSGPCNTPAPPFACFKSAPFGPGITLAGLKQGAPPAQGIDGNTQTVISVSMSGLDAKATVTGVEVNGVQFLP
ncbi:MAG: hypothetical protein ACT4PI_10230 [Actinomycetota bacterium]